MSTQLTQYGFYFDQGRCVDCKACTTACKSWYNLDPGPQKWARVMSWETGTFPNMTMSVVFAPCYHCANPLCIPACPFNAIYKEATHGAVLIDQTKCTGCRLCWQACPYGAPQFKSDAPTEKASMCTMCIDRLTQGLQPTCVMVCYMRALDFGKLSDLQAKYGKNADLTGVPASTATTPSVIFKPRVDHKNVVSYDAARVVQLMGPRDPYPAVYTDPTILTPQPGVVGRSAPNFKPKNAAEFMKATQNDEG